MGELARRLTHDEHGSALIITVGALPVLIILASFALDLGNWWMHKRQLQVRADSAALAAAGEMSFPCLDTAVRARAAQYGGMAANGAQPAFNVPNFEVTSANVHQLINSRTFFGQSASDDTAIGAPCTTGQVDVKMTEANLGSFFGSVLGAGIVPNINAQARVEIRQVKQARNFIPLSVSDPDWRRAQVTYFDEGNGNAVLGTSTLTKNGTDGAGRTIWDNATSPFSLDFGTAPNHRTRVGVRVALSANPSSVTCGAEGVFCYSQVLFLRGYEPSPAVSASGSPPSGGTPKARNVVLSPGSCDDGSFTQTATTSGSACTVTVQATLDWGVASPDAASSYDASVTATIAGGSAATLTRSGSVWSGAVSLPANAGARAITLDWKAMNGTIAGTKCGDGKGKNPNPCTGTFGTVQRTFSANATDSGPIQAAEVWTGSSLATAVRQNSFAACPGGTSTGCTYPIITRFAVPSNLEAAQAASDSVYRMRPLDGNSQTHALDCDSTLSQLEDELALGCSTPSYVINSGESCSSYNNAGGLPNPSPCVVTQTGQSASAIGKGLNRRVLGDAKPSVCTSPNRWSSFPNLPQGDKRIVYVVLTSYGTFSGSGNQGFPTQRFAAFYITGWQGNSGFTNPCQGNGDDAAAAGEVVGHFIKYVQKVNDGGAGDQLCDLTNDSLGLCVPVLTR